MARRIVWIDKNRVALFTEPRREPHNKKGHRYQNPCRGRDSMTYGSVVCPRYSLVRECARYPSDTNRDSYTQIRLAQGAIFNTEIRL